MQQAIIIIIVVIVIIGLLLKLGKHVLFNPRVNSILTLIGVVVVAIIGIQYIGANFFFGLPAIIIIIVDCVRDIMISPDFYSDVEVRIDKLYMAKSLTSLFTYGSSRLVFFLIVQPCLSYSVKKEIQRRIDAWKPLPDSEFFDDLKAKEYYYQKHIDKLLDEGVIVSNIYTVDETVKSRRELLDKLYPKKIVAKIADAVAGDKDAKDIRKKCEKKLASDRIKQYYAYISTEAYDKLKDILIETMSSKGNCSSCNIVHFPELKVFHPDISISKTAFYNATSAWSEYFVIQTLSSLVKENLFEENNFNDNDPFDNPAYRYAKSTVKMPSIDADNDPLLALD